MFIRKAVTCLLGATVILWSTTAFAAEQLEITEVVVDESSPQLLFTVIGNNFDNGGDVELWLGGIPLDVLTQSGTVISAVLPEELPPPMDGSYQLVVKTGNGNKEFDDFDGVTIGGGGLQGPAGPIGPEGPQGPQGETGAAGSQGEQGIQGEQGLPGNDGAPGTPGQPGANGQEGAPGPKGDKGDPGIDGTNGTDGVDAPDRSEDICVLYAALNVAIDLGVTVPDYCVVIPETYAIGDIGPAGGIVFYVTDGGLHGLEAAPEDQGIAERWGCWGIAVGATGTAVGTGPQNTANIVAECSERSAGGIADAYTRNGYGDWFLPSKDELNLAYLQKDVVEGSFADDASYWSSTESSTTKAWYQVFRAFYPGLTTQYESEKSPIELRVRAVRAF